LIYIFQVDQKHCGLQSLQTKSKGKTDSENGKHEN